MAPIFTKRLFSGQVASSGEVVLFAAGPEPTVVRDVVLGNTQATEQNISLISQDQAGARSYLVNQTVPAQRALHVDLRQALLEAEELHLFSDAGQVAVRITGYVFS